MSVPRQVPSDCCLQCGKSREQVKDYFDSPCATATYGEYVEGLDDWPRHHWRDWSDAFLRRAGLREAVWSENRRTGIYDLEFPARESICAEDGHAPLDDVGDGGVCPRCYEHFPTVATSSRAGGEP